MLVSRSNGGEAFVKCFGGWCAPFKYIKGSLKFCVTGYLLMEKMDDNLWNYLSVLHRRYPGGVPSSYRALIALAMVKVVEELERLRVSHGDLRGPNFLVSGDVASRSLRLKLADFGLARKFGDTPTARTFPRERKFASEGRTFTGLRTACRAAGVPPDALKRRHPTHHPMRGCVDAGASVDAYSLMTVLLNVVYGLTAFSPGLGSVYRHYKKFGLVPGCSSSAGVERRPYAQFRELATNVLDLSSGEKVVRFAYMRQVLHGIHALGRDVLTPYLSATEERALLLNVRA
jgi:serine/threonine protein kinase